MLYFVKSGGVTADRVLLRRVRGRGEVPEHIKKCSHTLSIITQQKTPPYARGAYGNPMPQDFKHKRKNIKPHAIITHAQNLQLLAFLRDLTTTSPY